MTGTIDVMFIIVIVIVGIVVIVLVVIGIVLIIIMIIFIVFTNFLTTISGSSDVTTLISRQRVQFREVGPTQPMQAALHLSHFFPSLYVLGLHLSTHSPSSS